MKELGIILTIMFLATGINAQSRDTLASRVKWIHNLPAPVQEGWKNCKYAAWKVEKIKRLLISADTLYTIQVVLYQTLGPDDADIAEEDLLFFSNKGQLIKTVSIAR